VHIRVGKGIPLSFPEGIEVGEDADVTRDFNVADGVPIGTPAGVGSVEVIVPVVR
jgi:serine acetyltransferase